MFRDVVLLGTLLLFATGSQGAIAPWPGLPLPAVPGLHGPPAAPDDGHRREHPSGVWLRFDAALGVYAVQGARRTWYFDDGFIRSRAGAWEFSAQPHGPWLPGRAEWVPLRLRVAFYHATP